MNPKTKITISLAALLLSGCTSGSAKSSSAGQPDPAQTLASETESGSDSVSEAENTADVDRSQEEQSSDHKKTDQKTSSAVSLKSLTFYGDEFRNAFKKAGFEIFDVEEEVNEYSFEAVSNEGRCDISLERCPSEDAALLYYRDEIHDQEDDSLISSSSQDEGLLSLTVINGTAGSSVSYIGFNKKGQFVLKIDDLQLNAEKSIKPILKELGYPVCAE